MAQKCVHQGCGKTFTDENEECKYHPGPPIFHEGQKGWKCCKPRVLTFDEFLTIPPCTTGRHSTTDLPPQLEKRAPETDAELQRKIDAASALPTRKPIAAQPQRAQSPALEGRSSTPQPQQQPESDTDDDALPIPEGRVCRRKGCEAAYNGRTGKRDKKSEKCVHHPGVPIFHEGSKGYSCCRRRVLEFDQFLALEGCRTKEGHLFVGSGRKEKKAAAADGQKASSAGGQEEGGADEEAVESVRNDFYQTPSTVNASFFLKKIDKAQATVTFNQNSLAVDLPTTDSPVRKRYRAEVPLYGAIDPAKSTFKILGTKLEVSLAKADGAAWPVLRSDQPTSGEIYQVGRAGRLQ